jgi:hypothetical protein
VKNIIWVAGGDRNPDDVRAQTLALVEGIRSSDSDKLWTAHCSPDNSAADQYSDQPWLAINSIYSYHDLAEKCLRDYTRAPVRPLFLAEANYENDIGSRTGEDTRREAWLAALCGTCGQFFGNRPIWLFGDDWSSALGSPGARYQVYLWRCLLSRHWEKFVPEAGRWLLSRESGSGERRKVAVATKDSMSALVYLPKGGQVEIQLALKGSQMRAWWFDPRDGSNQEIGTFAIGGRHTFSAPDSNDWVLVLDTTAHDVPPPGTRNIFRQFSQIE